MSAITDQFAALTKDLLYPSESDAPFESFEWPGEVDARAAVELRQPDVPVVEMMLDAFFDPLEETPDGSRYAEVRKALSTTLKNLRVFHAGEVEIAIYLVGESSDGSLVGLRTNSVET